MCAQAESRAKNDFVEHGSAGVDDELAALGGFDDAAQIAGVHFGDGDNALLTQKTARAGRIAIATPHRVALTVEKLCEEGAGRPRSQNEDPHGVKETLSQERPRLARHRGKVGFRAYNGQRKKVAWLSK